MPRSRRASRRSRHDRAGLFDAVLEGASGVVGTVAKDLAPEVVGALDVNALVQEIDIQAVLERVDLDDLLTRVDLDGLIARIDVQALLDRVDLDELVGKIDVNAVLAQVDVDALVQRTEIGGLIARSGAGVAGKVLDVARSQGVGLDGVLQRWTDRVLHRSTSERPGGPPLLVDAVTSP